MFNKKGQKGLGTMFIIVLLVIFGCVYSGYDTVDASHRGVKVKFGEVKGTIDAGMHWTGMFTDVYTYNLKVRQMNVELNGINSAFDKEGQDVYASIQVNYKLNPAKVQEAYSTIGKDENLETLLNINGVITEGFKTVISGKTLDDVITKQAEIKSEAIEVITQRFEEIEYFDITNVIITNIDYNSAIKQSINNKKTAEKNALTAVAELKVAEAKKEISIKQAEAAAAVKIEEAKAKAETLRLIAEAEAKALELKSAELTELMVRNNYIDKWDGQMPVYVTSGNEQMLLSIGE